MRSWCGSKELLFLSWRAKHIFGRGAESSLPQHWHLTPKCQLPPFCWERCCFTFSVPALCHGNWSIVPQICNRNCDAGRTPGLLALLFVPLLFMGTCHAGFPGAEILYASVVVALPGSLRTHFLVPERPASITWLQDISSSISALGNTLVPGVGIRLILQQPKSQVWVPGSRAHHRSCFRRWQGYLLAHHTAPPRN